MMLRTLTTLARISLYKYRVRAVFVAVALVFSSTWPAQALTEVCPGVGIQGRTPGFSPGGIILTAFDRTGIWVYNIDRDARYPLPETRPCGSNCRLSPDARWTTYIDPSSGAIGKMRLDGTERTPLVTYATDVEWWSPGRLLVWTPGHRAYLQAEGSLERDYLPVQSVVSVQPGGLWALAIEPQDEGFTRNLLNLETRNLQGIAEEQVSVGPDTPYYNAGAWSPDGTEFAFVNQGSLDGSVGAAASELFMLRPGDSTPQQLTDLFKTYGAARINGRSSTELSWSPDSTQIAFWVIELTGPDVEANTGAARLHVLNTLTHELRVYCGFATNEHTPDPPRLVWSPDSSYLAFSGNVPGDDKGYLVLALNIKSGVFTELSNGVYPALGRADLVAWGLPPP